MKKVATNTIDAGLLAKMFLAGAKNLEVKKEWINELNVFPVPDGDTGTNMTLTIMSAVKEVNSLTEVNMYNLSKAISSGSLRGARGNSGVILSQLLRGFTKKIRDYQELNAEILAEAMEKAVETAYKAVMKPKEGTILTVAKGAAEKAAELAPESEDLNAFIEDVLAHAEYVLSQTPEMLPVLKEAGVVDSGGQGLLTVLQGAYDAFLGKEIDLNFEMPEAKTEFVRPSKETEKEIKFGYCTEFIIMLENPLPDEEVYAFKDFLNGIGDSIVLVADDELVKVHVHTNDPGKAISKALTYGQLTRMKIDNMREEHQERLIKNAEKIAAQQAEEDKKRKEGIDARNEADSLVFQTQKALDEAGDKLDANDKANVEADLNALKSLVESTDAENMTDAQVDEIKAAKEKLMTSAQNLFAKMYEANQAAGGAAGAGPDMGAGAGPDAGAQGGSTPYGDDVVDGDYKEV